MRQKFQASNRIYEVEVERNGESYRATIDGQTFAFELLDSQPGQFSLSVDTHPATIYWAADGGARWLSMSGCTYHLEKPRPAAARPQGETTSGQTVRALMPAQVRAVQVEAGQIVDKGQTLLLLEAMKMEIRVRAPASGKIAKVLVEEGQTVDKEQVLVEMEG